MTVLDAWLEIHATPASAPLFAEQDLHAETFRIGTRRLLRRHPAFDHLMIELVEAGVASSTWQGLIYVMHWRRGDRIAPLYIGKTERRGVKHALSANIRSIRSNRHKFGRWGYGLDYHLGDLSHAMFWATAYRAPARKYRRWAETLFATVDPPLLRERVYVALISWHNGMRGPSGLVGSVASVEKELVALAGADASAHLLNVDGR